MAGSDNDPFDLERFVKAQNGDSGPDYRSALEEVIRGEKRSHWMWYVFPQIMGLGSSANSIVYSIGGIEEAKAFLFHPVLGERIRAISEALLKIDGRSATEIFGQVDSMKLRSSMTLFEVVAGPDSIFSKVLDKYFEGKRDERTMSILTSDPR